MATHRRRAGALLLALSFGCRDQAKAPAPGPAPEAAPVAASPPAKKAKRAAGPRRFVDVTEASGIRFRHHPVEGTRPGDAFRMNHYMHGSGLACGDVDGDGRIDLLLLDQDGPNHLYRNLGGLRFQELAAGANVALPDRVSTAAAFADLDRDGDQDLLVSGVRAGIAVLENKGRARFEAATAGSGLESETSHIAAIGLIDGDGDGLLDVFAGHSAIYTTTKRTAPGRPHQGLKRSMHYSTPGEASHYHRNKGGLRFEDVTRDAGMALNPWDGWSGNPDPFDMLWVGDAVVTDFEPDGRPDLVVSNMAGLDRWYRNVGGRFELVSEELAGKTTFGSFGLAVTDFNGDGRLDLAVADMHSDMFLQPGDDLTSVDWTEKHGRLKIAKTKRLAQHFIFGNTLYEGVAEGLWPERSDTAGVENLMPWGVIAADFDLDGDEDLFYPAGMGWPWRWSPDFFYLNDGAGGFSEALDKVGLAPTEAQRSVSGPVVIRHGKDKGQNTGVPHALASRAAVACDFDDDGDQDLVIMRWGAPAQLFENRLPAPEARSLVLSLTGTKANTDAVGARVEVVAGGKKMVRMIPGTGGYLSAPDRRAFFGIPSGATVESVSIQWPFGAIQSIDPGKVPPGPTAHRVTQ